MTTGTKELVQQPDEPAADRDQSGVRSGELVRFRPSAGSSVAAGALPKNEKHRAFWRRLDWPLIAGVLISVVSAIVMELVL